jgi:hypothetical protein
MKLLLGIVVGVVIGFAVGTWFYGGGGYIVADGKVWGPAHAGGGTGTTLGGGSGKTEVGNVIIVWPK